MENSDKDEMSDKNPNAVSLGRLGGLKGGPARAAKLSREERKRIAQIAAKARWKPNMIFCPFCRTNSSLVVEMFEADYFVVVCENCNAVGPDGKDNNEAIKKWNGQS